jgi:ABC-type branched-subunit amino acid transport system substrate-binding protein
MTRKSWAGALMALALVATACGRDESTSPVEATDGPPPAESAAPAPAGESVAPVPTEGGDTTVANTEAPPLTDADPCAGAALEDTDIGVSADKITVLVMADVGSELAPGLFQGNLDGAQAWAKDVNANGGLACRQIEVIEWDSKISQTESTNGFLEACSKAVAMIGSNSLFIGDVSIIETCKDAAGADTGIADISERAVDAIHQCSDHVFAFAGVNGSCPYSGEGPRDYESFVGPFVKYTEIAGAPLHGIYLVPSDLPSTIASSMPTIRGLNQAGLVVSDGEYGVSGRAEQAVFAEYVAAMKTSGSNVAINGSNDQAMIKLRTEAKAQGLDESGIIWACSLSCYTEGFKNDPNVDGTYLWLPFLPFEERDSNPEIVTFLDTIGQDFPQSWAVGAWNSGRAFEQAVNAIVASDGPNGITRARILDEMAKVTDFTNGGWVGSVDYSKKQISGCFVMMQLTGGEYKRVWPEEVGTLDCDEANKVTWSGDSAGEFKG